jgi:hypothetical protein
MATTILSSLGKAFVIAAFVPSLLFAIGNRLFITPVLSPQLAAAGGSLSLAELGIEGAAFVLTPALIGMVLMALNQQIIRLFEGAHGFQQGFLLKPLLERQRERHRAMFADLQTLRQSYKAEKDDLKRHSLLRAIQREHSKIFVEGAAGEMLPQDERRLAPTRLGNAFAVMEEYPYLRYGMDGMTFWPRLVGLISGDYKDLVGDEKTTLDFLLNLSLLSVVFGLEALLVSYNNPIAFVLLAAASWLAAYLAYRSAVDTALTLGELIKSCFDLFRHDLLKQLGFDKPASLEEEQRLWAGLTNYILVGEAFYYPRMAKEAEGEDVS